MRTKREYKIEKIISNDETRTQLGYAYLYPDKKTMIATDGHRLVSVPVELEEKDVKGPVTSEAIIAARKAGKLETDDLSHVACNGSLAVNNGPSFQRPDDSGFPEVDRVIPKFKSGDKGTVTIGLNPRYLYEIAQAIGSDEMVTITINVESGGTYDPILVLPRNENPPEISRRVSRHAAAKEEIKRAAKYALKGAFGLLMPMRN